MYWPDDTEKKLLEVLVYSTNLEPDEKAATWDEIKQCDSYKWYNRIRIRLEDRQLTLDEIPFPNQTDIKAHLKRFCYEA